MEFRSARHNIVLLLTGVVLQALVATPEHSPVRRITSPTRSPNRYLSKTQDAIC
jgi:hypothetical protein